MQNFDPESMLPLTETVFNIFVALGDSPKHGYAILKQIEYDTKSKKNQKQKIRGSIPLQITSSSLIQDLFQTSCCYTKFKTLLAYDTTLRRAFR